MNVHMYFVSHIFDRTLSSNAYHTADPELCRTPVSNALFLSLFGFFFFEVLFLLTPTTPIMGSPHHKACTGS